MPRISRILWIVAATMALVACQRGQEAPAPEIRPVRVVKIESRPGGETFALTGTVQAESEINLAFRIDGRLVERMAQVGDTLRPGQVVARLDPQNEQSSLQAAQAQLRAAQAQLAEARNNFVRFRDLVAENAVSRASFEQAESMQKAAESQVESAQTQVTLATNRLDYTRLVAELAGVVTATGAEPGEVVGPGRMIVQVAREGARDAVFDVPGRVKDVLPLNSRVVVTLVSDPAVQAAAVVREVAPRADALTGTFRVRARLVNAPAPMRLGTTVTGRVDVAGTPSIEVPTSAVVRSDRRASVWVVDAKTGTVNARPIEIRSSDPNRVVVAQGLSPGDLVVVAGVQALRPGQKVRLLETKQ